MPVRPFIVTQAASFEDQPVPAGERLILRSSAAGDVSPLTLTASGLVSATPTAESIDLSTLDGRIEQQTTNSFTTLTMLKLDAAPSGTVSVRGQGTKAGGSIALASGGPVAGNTVSVGLNGYEKVYTFRAGAAWEIVCGNVASLTQGDYLDIVFAGVTNRFWFDIDNAGTGAPSNPGTRTEVDITTGGSASDVATALEAAIEAITNLTSGVSTATITVTGQILGTMTVTDGAAATGFTLNSTVAGSSTSTDGNVLIGADRFETIRNLAHAINAAGTGSGTLWGSSMVANAYGQAYSDSNYSSQTFNGTSHSTIYLRDRLACARTLTWSVSSTDADLSIVAPSGGIDGDLLATLTTTAYNVSRAMNFNNPGLSAVLDGGVGLLLAASTPTSNALYIGGNTCTVRLKAANYSNAVTADIEFSDDGTNWASLGLSITTLDNNDQQLGVWNVEYLRLVISVNANTTDCALHAVVICP